MKVINVRNVNGALTEGIRLMLQSGEFTPSRGGVTLEIPEPVSTVYARPWERVLINKVRDANPFFHLMEAIWILAGRDDVMFLTEFNKRMVDYSDDGLTFNAPYGYRLKHNFNDNGNCNMDQLESVIDILKHDPLSRQAVCQIWDTQDLEKPTKDKACNMSIVFRIRNMELHMTVYNRSNDMIWGAYGANVVQFSMLQEYVAAHLKIPMGDYTQVSNSYHVYTGGPGGEVWDRLRGTIPYPEANYPNRQVLMDNSEIKLIDYDLTMFFNCYDDYGLEELGEMECWRSDYFNNLIIPVLCTYLVHKQHGPKKAIGYTHKIKADDWRIACEDWLFNRAEGRAK